MGKRIVRIVRPIGPIKVRKPNQKYKMQIKVLVIDDTLNEWKDKTSGELKCVRLLVCADMDPADRLPGMVNCSIPMDDPKAGPGRQASLRGMFLTLSIKSLRHFEHNKQIGFAGKVTSIDAQMESKPIGQPAVVVPAK